MKSNKIESPDFTISIFDEVDKIIKTKRLFFVKISTGQVKGKHGHFIQNQILFCIDGKLKVITKGASNTTKTITAGESIMIKKGTWISYEALENSYLCVASDQHYDEEDYYY
jgi:quercetin dioxygenase-like cupin family protein